MPPSTLPDIEPVPTLLARVRTELAADFPPAKPIRVSRAPGRLDVMGGIADYTGSLVCQLPLDRAAAVALQQRDDRQLQVFSFNLYDDHKPFTFRIPLEAMAKYPAEALRREFAEPGRRWAAYLAGCLYMLHDCGLVDLADPKGMGMNLAVYSTVPPGCGVSSSAALEVATMVNLVDHLGLRDRVTGMRVAELCQAAENRIVGAPCGIMDQITSCLGEADSLLRMVCQPHELLPPRRLPRGICVVGIDSNVRHDVGGPAYARTRCAAFMGHRIILEKMRQMGRSVGRELVDDPMRGYLANLDPDDYKRLFRSHVPALLRGYDFQRQYGTTIDPVTTIESGYKYAVQHATDHHVLEARRVRRFVEFLEQACDLDGPRRGSPLDRAGHLMYASHQSYTMDAMLGAPECDLLVELVRQRESEGFYGARITGGGSGGTVAVLARNSDRAFAALDQVMSEYSQRTRRIPQVFINSSPGAWQIGSALVR